MNLLIVDDQTSVVNGIVKGISWKLIGITNVYTAFNAFEAKLVLKEHRIDIMLCDIEMPIENGIQLLKWVRQENIDLECIFLTAHAEFAYAKEAIRAGGYDYIVQPAPYEEVQRVVSGAVFKVLEKNSHNLVYSYGKVMLEKKDTFKGTILRDIVNNNITQNRYDKYSEVVTLPHWSQSCYSSLFQIFSTREKVQQFGDELMQFIVSNVSKELFASYEQDIILYPISEFFYFICVYGVHGYNMDYEGFVRQITALYKNLFSFYELKIACYTSDATLTSNLKESYQKLIALKEKNVISKEGIFQEGGNEFAEVDQGYHLTSLRRWKQYLSFNLIDTVREEMKQFLNKLAEGGQLNQNNLYHFHIDLIRMVCDRLEEYKVQPHEAMNQIKNLYVYQDSVQSLSGMLHFIDEIMNLVEDNIGKERDLNVTELVKEYIHDNIGKDIKRNDVAEAVHLNADYLTRIFKKDTGMTVGEYIICEKMNVARNLIKTTALPIKFVASRVGYVNFSHFSNSYKKVHGISPSEDRK